MHPTWLCKCYHYELLRDCNSHKVRHQMATPTISTISQSLVLADAILIFYPAQQLKEGKGSAK